MVDSARKSKNVAGIIGRRIDKLIEDHIETLGSRKDVKKQLYIPGLDDQTSQQPAAEEFDMLSVRSGLPTTGKISFAMSLVNSLKCFLGIGILATPSVFGKIGIVGGNIGMIFIGFVSYYTMSLQIKATVRLDRGSRSYSDLGNLVLGSCAKMFVDVCMIFSQIGFAIAYLVFVGN